MAKKSSKPLPARNLSDEMRLREFCVEQAQRWPVVVKHYGISGGFGGMDRGHEEQVDADLIGRAEKIYTWMTRARG